MVALGTELYYRYLNPHTLGNTGSLSYRKWAKNHIRMNNWGFRDKDRSVKKLSPDTHRVLVIGPSNVYGQGVDKPEDRLTERLERILNTKTKTKVEVVNLGTMTLDPVGTAFQLLKVMNQSGVEYDSVVLYYAWNSIKHIPAIGKKYMGLKKQHYRASTDGALTKFLTKNSYAFDWLNTVSKDKSYLLEGKTYHDWHMQFYAQDQLYKQHIETLKAFRDIVASRNKAKTVVLITPNHPEEAERKKSQALVDKFKASLDQENIYYADATKIYDGLAAEDIAVSKYEAHNKDIFYEDMAEQIYLTYMEKGLIKQ